MILFKYSTSVILYLSFSQQILTSNINLPFEEHILDSTETVFQHYDKGLPTHITLGKFSATTHYFVKKNQISIFQKMVKYIAKQVMKKHLVYSVVLLYKVVKKLYSFLQDLHLEIIKKKQNYVRTFRSLGNSHRFLTNWLKI